MIAFMRFEIVRTLRNVRFLVMLLAFPVLLYLIYAKQHGTSQGLTVATLLLVSLAVYSGMGSAMFASGPQLARERQNGWMRQLRISPISTRSWFAAKLVQSILLIIPGLVALLALALTLHTHLVPRFTDDPRPGQPFPLTGTVPPEKIPEARLLTDAADLRARLRSARL
jgi:ABC-2 type transport system permease protein